MSARLDELDRISRTRELAHAESLELEREIRRAEGRRLPQGLTKALARAGVKRARRAPASLAHLTSNPASIGTSHV